jgi:hypothetical protein
MKPQVPAWELGRRPHGHPAQRSEFKATFSDTILGRYSFATIGLGIAFLQMTLSQGVNYGKIW